MIFTQRILIILLLTLFLSCHDDENSNKKNKRSKKIEYASMWLEYEPQAKFLKYLAEKFKKETGMEVKINFIGRDILTIIYSQLLMKDAPDLIDQDLNELTAALFINKKAPLCESLTDMFYHEEGPEGQERLIDIFDKKMIELYKMENNEIYFFPYSIITSGFFYNKKLFDTHNIKVPITWNDFFVTLEKLKSAGITPIAHDGEVSFYNAYYYYWAVQRVLGSGYLKKASLDKSGKTWENPGFKIAASLIEHLSNPEKKYFHNNYKQSRFPDSQVPWAKNKSGIILCGSWIPSETYFYIDINFEYGFFPFPVRKNQKNYIYDIETYLIGCVIPIDSKNKEEAKRFLKFMLRKENADEYARRTMNISARKDAVFPDSLIDIKPYLNSAQQFHAPYDGVMGREPEWWATVFYPANNDLFFGNISASEFINTIKNKSIQYWKDK